MESTTPVAAPAKATKGRDFDPISSSCRNHSRNSKGGVTAARKTCQENMPQSPNHSKNWLIKPLVEATLEDMMRFELPYRGTCLRFASISRFSNRANPALALHGHYLRCMRESKGWGPL